MSIDKIQSMNIGIVGGFVPEDEEYKRIKRKLWFTYGIKPSGNKVADKNKLKELEMKEFLSTLVVSNKYLLISISEQQKIIAKKKEKRKELNPEKNNKKFDKQIGAKLLGDQIYMAIKMKKEREEYGLTDKESKKNSISAKADKKNKKGWSA